MALFFFIVFTFFESSNTLIWIMFDILEKMHCEVNALKIKGSLNKQEILKIQLKYVKSTISY